MTLRELQSIGVPPRHTPWEDLEDTRNRRAAQRYWDNLRAGAYLNQTPFSQDAEAGVVQKPGAGLLLIGEDADAVALSLLVAIVTDDDTPVRMPAYPVDPRRARAITRYDIRRRGRVMSAPDFCSLSKDAFDDTDARDSYHSLIPTLKVPGLPSPFLLHLRDWDLAPHTEWNAQVLARLLKSRWDYGFPTIVSAEAVTDGGLHADRFLRTVFPDDTGESPALETAASLGVPR